MILYLLGILLSLSAGYLVIRLLTNGEFNPILHILLAIVLGFGIIGTLTFYTHILFNFPNRFLSIGIVILGILILYLGFNKNNRSFPLIRMTKDYKIGLITLGLLTVPLAISGHYYPLGGWDAWSCWSLKAKFIFLGQENWKDVLAPNLWRSNTHYPLLWPLINVWFWDLGGQFNQAIPMFNSIAFALLTAGLLLFGLLELTGNLWVSIAASVIVTSLPLGVTLYTSQYSDALLGLFLLSAFLSLLLAKKYNLPKLKILCVIFLGAMSFTKNEGLIAAMILALLIFWHEGSNKKELKLMAISFFIALLPTIIFTLWIAPKNEAFINGLVSVEKPSNWGRLSVILIYPLFEFISWKWNGFWILTFLGAILAGRKLWQSTLGLIGLSLILYLAVVMAYYYVNTFFEIGWWLSTTLSRILFALIPTIILWILLGILNPKEKTGTH